MSLGSDSITSLKSSSGVNLGSVFTLKLPLWSCAETSIPKYAMLILRVFDV